MVSGAEENAVRQRIVECAAATIRALGGGQEINILRLPEYLGEHSALAYQALGWLAREGRIRYRQSGTQVYVSLSEENRHKADNGTL